MTVHDEFTERVDAVQRELAGLPTIKHLLALIADPKAANARIAALEKILNDIEAARSKLAAERQAHVERVDRDMTLLAKRVA
jgi:hypothetical protein